MIISKTPYRISFFGGGSDYPNWYKQNTGLTLSTTIDKYIYITCRKLPPFFKHKHRVIYSKIEAVKKANEIKHTVFRNALKHFEKENFGFEVHYDGDLPSKSGMGSSSAFTVGLLNSFYNYNNKGLSKNILADKSIFFEQNVLKEIVGSQDQISTAFGGFNLIKYKNGNYKVNSLNQKYRNNIKRLSKNLVLIYTGIERKAEDIAKTFVGKINKEKKSEIQNIVELAEEGFKYFKDNDLNSFGKLLHESWLVKKQLSKAITNNKIDNLYEFVLKNGSIGGKILGAGGGGFMLVYVDQNLKKKLIQKIKKKCLVIPFEFENEGSKILKI